MKYKCVVKYNGYNYSGWQKQPNNTSIQEEITKVLSIINKKTIEIVASGRTDAKVHALAQVFHFESDIAIDINRYVNAMNALLPLDIRILKVEIVDEQFHARFSAIAKRYDYLLSYDDNNPFNYQTNAIIHKKLDYDKMCDVVNVFIGTHDFTSFTSAKIDERKPRIKTITRLEINEVENGYHFIIEGNGFLRYMVRMIVGTIIQVGLLKISKEDVISMLEKKDKHACRYKADPNGLYLHSVKYKEEI